MPSPHPQIAIVGSGPGGLALGVLLHKQKIPFTIFERRQKPTEEDLAKPSGMLDLHEESGLKAIREAGLYEAFLPRTNECAEDQKVLNMRGDVLWTDRGELSERPEISRHALTSLLDLCIPDACIKYGHKLVSATTVSSETGDARTELDFGPHGKHTFDLVVGADGAWSKVRALVTDITPSYAGSQNITATIRQISTKYPHLAELVGRGSFSALGLRHGVMSQRGPMDSARILIFLSTDEANFKKSKGLEGVTAVEAKDKFLNNDALLGRFGPAIKELVAVACDEETADNPGAEVDIKSLYMLPIGVSWEHRANVTLIGDAAHLMCPWAGEGVNLALWDALLLSQAIIKAWTDSKEDDASFQTALDPLMEDFEKDMAARAGEKASETLTNGQMLFGDGAANSLRNFFASAYGEPASQL